MGPNEMSEEERVALQAEHDEVLREQRMAESDQLAQNEAGNYARLHAPVELEETEEAHDRDVDNETEEQE